MGGVNKMVQKQTERMMGNRIGDGCWYKHEGKWKGGKLRAWSMNVSEVGPASWPVAVVEDDKTHRIVVTHAENISFHAEPPRD